MNSGSSELQDIDSETFESSTSDVIGNTCSEKVDPFTAEIVSQAAEQAENRSQGNRTRTKKRAWKSFSSHKRKMKKFFQVCAEERRASSLEKQRLGIIYHKMLSKQKLQSNDQRFFFALARRFCLHHNQTSEVLNCAAWEAGIFPAGEREVFAHTQEEVEAIGLEEQATSGISSTPSNQKAQRSLHRQPKRSTLLIWKHAKVTQSRTFGLNQTKL